MSLCSNLCDKLDENILEDLTSNVKQVQDNVLEEILTLNAETEYLRRFLQGSSDKELFKKNVPVTTYEDVKLYIDRVANGEPFDVISGKPITGFLLSSGTSGGKRKMFPRNNKYLENLKFIYYYRSLVISKHIDGLEHGKGMVFNFCTPEHTTPSGLPASAATTSFFKSDYFKNRPSFWHWSFTSPDEVILCSDNKQSLYCHLLCGIVQRDEVVKVGAAFVSILVRAITFLEKIWKEICTNIRYGRLSEWITDISCMDSVSKILGEPNPELADLIENECNQKSWEGIIPRLWPKTKFIESIATGQMAQHIPTLEFYSNKLPLISSSYVSSETMFGINMNPLCKPQDVSYTFMPNFSYFEFLLVDAGDKVEVVDLVDVKLGYHYEPLVTNHSGLLRHKIGDILQVTGFYNSAPQFRFVRRGNLVLSVHLEITTDEDLLNAVTHAKTVLESSNLMLIDFTSYADVSTTPGHYVLYWELKGKYNNDIAETDNKVLAECCYMVEESLNNFYKEFRSKEGSIGALEIRVVQQGTFDSLMEFFITQGASSTQYKTPICIKSSEALAILEEKVRARFFTDKVAPVVKKGIIALLYKIHCVIAVNGKFPGPVINATTNYNVDVNVFNRLDEPLLLTWNGIEIQGDSWQDGVLGTNCPIPPNWNFTYSFQVKDQIGSFFYFPSLNLQRASGGFGPIIINNRDLIPLPFNKPDGEISFMIGDWYTQNHTALRGVLDSGSELGMPDGVLINGKGPYKYHNSVPDGIQYETINVDPGKTYRIRVHNVGTSTSLNFRIQNHKLLLVETEGHYNSQTNFTDFDIHVGQSYSFLVTMDQNASSDYYIVASARFVNETAWQRVTGVGILHYSNSKGQASGPLPVPATDVSQPWSVMNQQRAIKQNTSASGARPNPQGSFHYGQINITSTYILRSMPPTKINGSFRATLNWVSFLNPSTPMRLADKHKVKGVYKLDFPNTPADNRPPRLDSSILNATYKGFIQIIFQNSDTKVQSFHIDGYSFYVVA
ncbi:hypothetical protein Bca101_026889 [Brassica carinata]